MDGSGEQQQRQRQRQRQPKKQQQQPAEKWVAGVAHEDVEGMQLAQLGNDVTQTETRITLLKQQAATFQFRANALSDPLRAVKKELAKQQKASNELKANIEKARAQHRTETTAQQKHKAKVLKTQQNLQAIEETISQGEKAVLEHKILVAQQHMALNDRMQECQDRAKSVANMKDRPAVLARRIEAAEKTQTLEAQIRATKAAIRAHEEAAKRKADREAERARKRQKADGAAEDCKRLEAEIVALDMEIAAQQKSSSAAPRPSSASGRRPTSVGRKEAAAAAMQQEQQEQEGQQEETPMAVDEEDEQEGQRFEEEDGGEEEGSVSVAAVQMALRPPGGGGEGARTSVGSSSGGGGRSGGEGEGDPPAGFVPLGGMQGQEEEMGDEETEPETVPQYP